MPEPSDAFGMSPIPPGIWNDEFRGMGGVNFEDMRAQQLAEQQRQAEATQRAQYEQQSQADAVSNAQLQAQYDDAQKNFVDWPTFQKTTPDTEPGRQYDGYLGTLEAQLTNMGYTPEEAQQEVAQFQKMVPRPAEDFGIIGNLLESMTGGFGSGTRAVRAGAAAAMGDDATLAQLGAEGAGVTRNAALSRFNRAIGGDPNSSNPNDAPATDLSSAAARFGRAAFNEPQGLLDFFVDQITQSYPVLLAGAGGALAGSPGGPIGTGTGLAAGTAAGSFALDAGSTILDTLTQIAQSQGVDPTDKAAMLALLQDPYTRQKVVQAGIDHGFPVAVMDGLTSVLSGGLGVAAGRSLKAGRSLRATGYGAAGLATEMGGGAAGEALGQINQSGSVTAPMDVFMEAMGELGPGIAHTAGGAVYDRFRKQPAAPAPPPGPIEPTLGGLPEEGDLPGSFGTEPTLTPDSFNRTSLTDAAQRIAPEVTAAVAQAEQQLQQIHVEELPMEEIDLQAIAQSQAQPATIEEINAAPPPPLPGVPRLAAPQAPTLAVTPEGVVGSPEAIQAERDKQRIAALAPQVGSVDVNDLESLLDRMINRGIAVEPDSDVHLGLDFIATAPKTDKQVAIAAVIDGLGRSNDPNADEASLELIRIAHQLQPRRKVTPVQAQASINQIAVEIGTTPDQVVPVIAQALAQELVDAIVTTSQPAATQAAAPAVAGETPIQAKRGLRRGEAVPGANLANIISQLIPGGPVQGQSSAAETQGKPRRSLRARVPTQGPVALGSDRPGVGGTNQVSAGVESDNPAGARTVRGFQYGVDGTKDVANTDALQRMKEEANAKKQTGGVGKKGLKKLQTERKRGIDLAVMTKEEYEKQYPGRDYDADLNTIILPDASAPVGSSDLLSPSALRTLQLSPFNSIMEYLSAVMPMPLQRLVAQQLERLDLQVPVRVAALSGTQKGGYHYSFDGVEVAEYITIDPTKGTLNTVLHEAVHAATVAALRDPQTEKQRQAAARMNELYEYAKQMLPNSTQYGLSKGKNGNVFEFVAEAFANPGFQKDLQAIPLPNPTKYGVKNLLDMFKRLVLRLLGLNTSDNVLSETLLAGSDLFSNRKVAIDIELAEKARGATAPSTAIVGAKSGTRAFIAYAKGDKYTLYPTTAAEPRGVKGQGLTNLTREQAEGHMRAAGAEVLPPVADSQAAPGTPKTSSTKLVGFAPNGDLQVAAYEQKDGTWTYYESDSDVRTDPNATVYKGLTKDQAARYLAAKGVQPTAPKANAVKPNGLRASPIGYVTPSNWGVTWTNAEEALIAIGKGQKDAKVPVNDRVDIAAILRNSQVEQKTEAVHKQYVEPARKAGEQISKDFNKTQVQIEETLQNLHVIERLQNKIRQIQRGNMDAATQTTKINAANKAINDAQAYLKNLNPHYIEAIKRDLAPKLQALANNTIDMAAQYGLMDRPTAENIKRAYDFYVPLQTGDRTTVGKAATGKATAGDLSFARMQEQAYRTIARGEQNTIRRMVKNIAVTSGIVNNKDPSKSIVTVGATTKVRYDPETNSLNEGVDNHIFDDNTITVYEDGNRIPMSTSDPALLEALHPYKGTDRATALTTLLAITGFATKTIAIGKTALAPMFSPFNIMRDTSTAWINMPPGVSKVKYMQQVLNPETLYSAFTNVFREAFGGDFKGRFAAADRAGSLISRRAYVGLEVLANNVTAEFRPTVYKRLKNLAGINARGGSVFKVATAWSQALESATRYAVYKAAIESGLSEREAGVAAKTASVNFENRGVKNVSPLYMFANAKLQGLRALNESRKQHTNAEVATFVASVVGLGLAAGFLGYKYSDRDKDGKSKYLKIPDYKKDSMVLFKEGSYGMPLPQEVGSFYVLGNALADGIWGGKDNGAVGSRIFTSMVNTLWSGNVPQSDVIGHKARPVEFMLRSFVPTTAMPIVDFTTNRNTWGSEIVPGLEDKKKRGTPGYDMGSANESALAVNTAKSLHQGTGGVIDVAPQQLVYLNRFLNPTAEATSFFKDLLSDRQPKYEGEVVNPIARKFTGKATEFYDQDQFDELLSKATQAKYQATKQGIASLSIDDQALAKSADMLNRVQSDVKSMFNNSKLMTRERLNMLQDRKRELILDGIRRYNELRDRMPRN